MSLLQFISEKDFTIWPWNIILRLGFTTMADAEPTQFHVDAALKSKIGHAAGM